MAPPCSALRLSTESTRHEKRSRTPSSRPKRSRRKPPRRSLGSRSSFKKPRHATSREMFGLKDPRLPSPYAQDPASAVAVMAVQVAGAAAWTGFWKEQPLCGPGVASGV